MAEREITRRLAAIVAADVAGYSRLTGIDEEGTITALRRLRQDLIDPAVAQYRGRVANTAGDSLLIEFPSVVEALRCALAVQEGMRAYNLDIPPERRILFRIGINLGDVIEQDGDLLGDGVNVAARLEGLAEAGGICLSRAAHDQVRDRLDIAFEDLGEVEVKNIARPVGAFRVGGTGEPPPPSPRRRTTGVLLAVAVIGLVAVLAAGIWWWTGQGSDGDSGSPALMADRARPALPLPDKPSIAVLRFENMSGDPEQDYFADGMAEDIITDLSKIAGLFVIARNSSFRYGGDGVDMQTIGHTLGVRYLLEGSVRRAGDRLRINAQLIDAQSGGQLWAERYDGHLTDVFALQDRITGAIVQALSVRLTAGEQALVGQMETTVPEAYDSFLAGWSHFRARTVDDYRKALGWFEKAVALDPDYGRAWAALAALYNEATERAWADKLGLDPTRLPALLDKALMRPTPLAYQVEYELLMGKGELAAAAAALDKASALEPGDPDTYVMRSGYAAVTGDVDSAIDLMKTAMRLDPHYPAFDLYILGWHYLRAEDIDRAIEYLERAQARNPEDWYPLIYLTSAYVRAGRMADAEHTAQALVMRRKELGYFVTLVRSFDTWWTINGKFGEQVRADLRKAGIPDQVAPDALDLPPEQRLTEAELRENGASARREVGKLPNGEWRSDSYPDGTAKYYWNGRQFATSTSEIRGNKRFIHRSDGQDYSCTYYRNPSGTKKNLDEFISVCSSGIFPYATFPLPQNEQ